MNDNIDPTTFTIPRPYRIFDKDNKYIGEVDARSEVFARIKAAERFKVDPITITVVAHDR